MEDFTKKTLGELLSSSNDTIRRNAISILKQLQGANKENNKENKKTEWANLPKHVTEWKNEKKS